MAVRLYPENIIHPPKPPPPPPEVILSTQNISGQKPPESISIPSLAINLSIAPAVTKDNEWTLYDDKISWLVTSKTPGNGNVILYGHNRENLFGRLNQLQLEEEISVEAGGKIYTYAVSEIKKVTPNDVEEILSGEDRLTLYTCEGSFDEKRLIVVAKPLGIDNGQAGNTYLN